MLLHRIFVYSVMSFISLPPGCLCSPPPQPSDPLTHLLLYSFISTTSPNLTPRSLSYWNWTLLWNPCSPFPPFCCAQTPHWFKSFFVILCHNQLNLSDSYSAFTTRKPKITCCWPVERFIKDLCLLKYTQSKCQAFLIYIAKYHSESEKAPFHLVQFFFIWHT